MFYIFYKRVRKTLSVRLTRAAFIRVSFCRLNNIILYYFIRANPIELFSLEILKVSRLVLYRYIYVSRRTYNISHTDSISYI